MVSVPFAVFGVCFRLLSLSRVLSSCVGPSPLFYFFCCLRVLCWSFSFSLSSFGCKVSLRVGAARSAASMVLHYFSPALFRGFPALPSSSVGLVQLFLLQAVVFHLSTFFLVVAPIFFLLGPLSSSLSSPSSGSSLGQLCPAFRVLAGVSSFGFLKLRLAVLRSSRLFLRRLSSSASSFYLLSCGLFSVGSSLLLLASFPLQALPAVFAVVFLSG